MDNRQAAQREFDRNRPSSSIRGYDRKWRRYRRAFLAAFPLCVECQHQGVIKEASVVDHIVDHNGGVELFWDRDNHQGLCAHHHGVKTAKEHSFGKHKTVVYGKH